MSEYIYSDEQIMSERRQAYEAGKRQRKVWTARDYHGDEIVRCCDCKHWQPWMKGAEPECWANGEPFSTPPDGFCAWGERCKDE